ncbi:MAG TPA: nicotinate phosphoribosyltransferase [Steroidobacteraceae bacterium]|nr:nicotinate phosphoribosyltransferase [Steroidobacteraceae bacterium]
MTASQAPALLTDLYQLTMLDAYYQLGMEQTAAFEFFVRRLPDSRNFLVAAGLEQVLDYLETLHFNEDELNWLANCGQFKPNFIERLAKMRFTGDVHAMPEGTVFFEDEPVLRVVAPLPQAQLIESRVINLLNLQISIASKAARCRIAAGDKRLVDFGMRRAHGSEAALLGARASYIGGFDATACVEAARQFGIPMSGTMAHSFVQAHDREADAFLNFATARPEHLTLLIDTYDTDHAARTVAALSKKLADRKIRIDSVRIDSGDLADESARVRAILDTGGCHDIKIFASGSVDEHVIASCMQRNAPIDGFGIGTKLSVSADAPALDCAYKLHEYAGKPRHKRSASKSTWPGRRHVHRTYDAHGRIAIDMVGCAEEVAEGKALLQLVMCNGRRMLAPSLADIRNLCRAEMMTLPPALLSLDHGPRSPVKISPQLRARASEMKRDMS